MDDQSTIEKRQNSKVPATKAFLWYQQIEPNPKYVWVCGRCGNNWPAMNIEQHPRQCPKCKGHWDEVKPVASAKSASLRS